MNVEVGTEAAQFPENEYINGIFVAVHFFTDKSQWNTIMLFPFRFELRAGGRRPSSGRAAAYGVPDRK
jgi:hypothetical protein